MSLEEKVILLNDFLDDNFKDEKIFFIIKSEEYEDFCMGKRMTIREIIAAIEEVKFEILQKSRISKMAKEIEIMNAMADKDKSVN